MGRCQDLINCDHDFVLLFVWGQGCKKTLEHVVYNFIQINRDIYGNTFLCKSTCIKRRNCSIFFFFLGGVSNFKCLLTILLIENEFIKNQMILDLFNFRKKKVLC